MTREEFKVEVEALRAEGMRIIAVSHALPMIMVPREEALFDELIAALDSRIRLLQMKTNVKVEYHREESVGHKPRPRLVSVTQTMINFDKSEYHKEHGNNA